MGKSQDAFISSTPLFSGNTGRSSRIALLWQTLLLSMTAFLIPASPSGKSEVSVCPNSRSIANISKGVHSPINLSEIVSPSSKWGKHIQVHASSNGRELSYYNNKGGYYVQSVHHWFNQHKTPEEQSSECEPNGFAAQQYRAVSQGYAAKKGQIQFATQSAGPLDAWRVNDPRQPIRFAVLLGQHESFSEEDAWGMDYDTAEYMDTYTRGFNTAVEADLANMHSVLTEHFKVPSSQIFTFPHANKENTLATLAQVHTLIKQARKESNRPIELVVFYAGHGTATEKIPETGDVLPEHFEGQLGIGVSETDLKRALNPMTEARILVKLDCCHAGVFTAMNTPRTPAAHPFNRVSKSVKV